ncbi:unnamed protein product [Brachionus calyciflorus]|uniref:EF-hand domain-containing protein n=1 Tax=Brachionus calyciflorus TaxID=104777 RepID=A0A814IB91_9BILA|nr:unnamed protein product [Brachionus calyciflorus]
MSYYEFRNFAGADNLIDFNEFLEITRQKYPHLDQQTIFEIARDTFSLMDKNGDGKINFNEYSEAKFRENTNPINFQQQYVRQPQTFYPTPINSVPSYQQYHQQNYNSQLPPRPTNYYQQSYYPYF